MLTSAHSFHACTEDWISKAFAAPTPIQHQAWPILLRRDSALLLAPTGSGKTLAAFLAALDRLMFGPSVAEEHQRLRVLYISPLKALGVDVDRNLRAPLAGIRAIAEGRREPFHPLRVAIRTGDTTSDERRQLIRRPPDILITTPESLFLMLTSRARNSLRFVETVIVDEIHTMIAGKRGAHLFVSLERLEELRGSELPSQLQRIGLSATVRPVDEAARILGGFEIVSPNSAPVPRPVQILDARVDKVLSLTVESPSPILDTPGEASDDSSAGPEQEDFAGSVLGGTKPPSVWPAIHSRLLELIREHRTTLVFVNSRRLAERLASAINELAEAEIALAHHGSLSREQRRTTEDRLKRGDLPCIVATSSLELGIDMGAVDLVVQIEAPPSISSGIQRIGRAGHRVGAPSRGVIFAKHRSDLLACAAAVQEMCQVQVEPAHYPRNPLDVAAQQIVAMVALEPRTASEVYQTLRRCAAFSELPWEAYTALLDLLSGRYPSDEFSELRPRIQWDRLTGVLSPKRGTQRLAIANAGTIPDRGLYGVYLISDESAGVTRIGELDEEMVFETKPGDVFYLGVTSWRVVEITRDRVLVTPAPGEPGRMPFWRGEGPGRPYAFGRAIGALTRRIAELAPQEGVSQLIQQHSLSEEAAQTLVRYVHDQVAATEDVPSDRTIVVETFPDEIGDWRVCILSPFGSRVHAPWAIALAGGLRTGGHRDLDFIWSDDGIMIRVPQSDRPPGGEQLFPDADEIESLVTEQLAGTALLAARFRENAARALLLPRRQPGRRTPLWQQRRRAADLLAVASRFPRFPILLETYRECLRDICDLPGLIDLLRAIQRQLVRVHVLDRDQPSPFATSLMFRYTGQFLYQQDSPLAERRAQLLQLDHTLLRELLGEVDLREILDPVACEQVQAEIQQHGTHGVGGAEAIHDLLLRVGALTPAEIRQRAGAGPQAQQQTETWLEELSARGQVIRIRIAGEDRLAASEDAARYRDALGALLPPGIPTEFQEPVAEPLLDLISRYARTHLPFTTEEIANHLGIASELALRNLTELERRNRLVRGHFLNRDGSEQWCDGEVLRRLKRRSLSVIRQRVEPVPSAAMARFLPEWQNVTRPRKGLDALLDTIEQLQGIALPSQVWEREVFPARLKDYQPADLDQLCLAGEIRWRGVESIGPHESRVALYLTDAYTQLAPPASDPPTPLAQELLQWMQQRGAVFFAELQSQLGLFNHDLRDALWQLVWCGQITNDSWAPIRSRREAHAAPGRRRPRWERSFRSRRASVLPGCEGRWSLLPSIAQDVAAQTARQTAMARQLLRRYGIVTRDVVARENAILKFGALYPVLRAMEDAGHVRRGYFVEGLGGAQFAMAGAEDRLRHPPTQEDTPLVLSALDPANAYGAVLPWPALPAELPQPARSMGTRVILWNGRLCGYLSLAGRHLLTFPPEDPADHERVRGALVTALRSLAQKHRFLLEQIDGHPAHRSPLANVLTRNGFRISSRGMFLYEQHHA